MIKILAYTAYPLQHMGKMASVCWDTIDQSPEKYAEIGKDCLDSGHHRVAEFPECFVRWFE